jgi:hypothetical protein
MNYTLDIPCVVTKITATGDEAKAESSGKKQEFCAVVKLPPRGGESIRAGSSSSPVSRQQPEPDAVLVLPMNTTANINDILQVEGVTLRVTHIDPIRDVVGKLDYYQVEAVKWE